MTERNQRKVYTGRVVSDKMDKTVTVQVETIQVDEKFCTQLKFE